MRSRSMAPPPPLISDRSGAISSAPSMATATTSSGPGSTSGMPSRLASASVAVEVGMPRTSDSRPSSSRAAISVTACAAVEPRAEADHRAGRHLVDGGERRLALVPVEVAQSGPVPA